MLTSLQKVPRGTNGAVTIFGLYMAAAGGAIIGLAAQFFPWAGAKERLVTMGASILFGVLGSVLDSFFGAVLQATAVDKATGRVVESQNGNVVKLTNTMRQIGSEYVDNNFVNFLTSTVMMAVGIQFGQVIRR